MGVTGHGREHFSDVIDAPYLLDEASSTVEIRATRTAATTPDILVDHPRVRAPH
jgi:hypothetical protein